MSRLLNVGRFCQGKSVYCDIVHVKIKQAIGLCNRSCSTASGSSMRPKSSAIRQNDEILESSDESDKIRQRQEDKQERQLRKIEKMRSRMRSLHGLGDESSHPVPRVSYASRDKSEKVFLPDETEDVSGNSDFSSDAGVAKTQLQFIRRVRSGNVRNKKPVDRVIETAFGQVRVDGMNVLPGQSKASRNSAVNFMKNDEIAIQNAKNNTILTNPAKNDPKTREINQMSAENVSVTARNHPGSEAAVEGVTTEFGHFNMPDQHRFDEDFSGNVGTSNDVSNSASQVTNIFEEQFFGDSANIQKSSAEVIKQHTHTSLKSDNIFEEQYFGEVDSTSTQHEVNFDVPELPFKPEGQHFSQDMTSDVLHFSQSEQTSKNNIGRAANAVIKKSSSRLHPSSNPMNEFDEQYFNEIADTSNTNNVPELPFKSGQRYSQDLANDVLHFSQPRKNTTNNAGKAADTVPKKSSLCLKPSSPDPLNVFDQQYFNEIADASNTNDAKNEKLASEMNTIFLVEHLSNFVNSYSSPVKAMQFKDASLKSDSLVEKFFSGANSTAHQRGANFDVSEPVLESFELPNSRAALSSEHNVSNSANRSRKTVSGHPEATNSIKTEGESHLSKVQSVGKSSPKQNAEFASTDVVTPTRQNSGSVNQKPTTKSSKAANAKSAGAKQSRATDDRIVSDSIMLENNEEETIVHEVVTKREIKQQSRPMANVENPSTAYDMAMKLRLEKKGKLGVASVATSASTSTVGASQTTAESRPQDTKWSGKLDSHGFRILDNQVMNLEHMTEDTLIKILKDSIIYEDDNVIAIDKPYGLPSHGGPGIHHSVGRYLVPLAAKLDRTGRMDSLHLVHRLDKETTGVMVLAKSKQISEMLLALFKKRMVIKRYWAITKGIPNPTEGVIDIPMAEGMVDDRYRMELRPLYTNDAGILKQTTDRVTGNRLEAITHYKVISSANHAALVECEPESGVKHQIRCHLAFGLNTPILGDHKYSHYTKFAPQKLYPEILQRLGIRQSKVRHLPMHLHAKSLVLPEFREGRNLFLSARLPKHFIQNMKWLKLSASD